MKLAAQALRALTVISLLSPLALGCDDSSSGGGGGGAGGEDTTQLGTFDGLFDGLVTGLNYA